MSSVCLLEVVGDEPDLGAALSLFRLECLWTRRHQIEAVLVPPNSAVDAAAKASRRHF